MKIHANAPKIPSSGISLEALGASSAPASLSAAGSGPASGLFSADLFATAKPPQTMPYGADTGAGVLRRASMLMEPPPEVKERDR